MTKESRFNVHPADYSYTGKDLKEVLYLKQLSRDFIKKNFYLFLPLPVVQITAGKLGWRNSTFCQKR